MNPLKTLGRWLWRWWNGREFERSKPLPERKPLPVGGAVALNQDPLRYSDSAKGMFAGFSWRDKNGVVHGDEFRGQTLTALTVDGPSPIGPGDSLNAAVGDTKPNDGLDWLKINDQPQ